MKKYIKVIWYEVREVIERSIFGQKFQELIWKFRHYYDKNKSGFSEKDYKQHHRKEIIEIIKSHNFETLIDIGCGWGANIININNTFENKIILGVDINKSALKSVSNIVPKNENKINYLNVSLSNLSIIESKMYDIVLLDAVLMFININNIENVIKEINRISKNIIIINDFNCDEDSSLFVGGRWVHNYDKLFLKKYDVKISRKKIENLTGTWGKYGNIITIINNK